jgi:hypothetical protein
MIERPSHKRAVDPLLRTNTVVALLGARLVGYEGPCTRSQAKIDYAKTPLQVSCRDHLRRHTDATSIP